MKERTFCSALALRRSGGRTGRGSVPCPDVLQHLLSRARLKLLLLLLWRLLLQVKPLFLPFSLCTITFSLFKWESREGVTTATPSPPMTSTIAHTPLRQALQSGWWCAAWPHSQSKPRLPLYLFIRSISAWSLLLRSRFRLFSKTSSIWSGQRNRVLLSLISSSAKHTESAAGHCSGCGESI